MSTSGIDLNYRSSSYRAEYGSVSSTLRQMSMDHNTGKETATFGSITPLERFYKPKKMVKFLRSLFNGLVVPMPCKWLTMPGRPSHYAPVKVTGTLFGFRKGHVNLAVQENPRSRPLLLVELATPTNSLVKEMASGLVRIALECERTPNRGKLFEEPIWSMYCNGRKTGYAMRRDISESDLKILGLVQAVSMGAGVLPTNQESPDGDLMYMRARFERVAGSRDSEAFYMMNPDGTGGPELSIFLLRV